MMLVFWPGEMGSSSCYGKSIVYGLHKMWRFLGSNGGVRS